MYFEQEIKHLEKFQDISLLVRVMQIQSHFNKQPDLISDYRSGIMEIGFVPVWQGQLSVNIFNVLSFKVSLCCFICAPWDGVEVSHGGVKMKGIFLVVPIFCCSPAFAKSNINNGGTSLASGNLMKARTTEVWSSGYFAEFISQPNWY